MDKKKVIIAGGNIALGRTVADKLNADVVDAKEVDDLPDEVHTPRSQKLGEIANEAIMLNSIAEVNKKLIYPEMTKKQWNAPPTQPVRTQPKVRRNDPCPCGSEMKYKKCCMNGA